MYESCRIFREVSHFLKFSLTELRDGGTSMWILYNSEFYHKLSFVSACYFALGFPFEELTLVGGWGVLELETLGVAG